MLRVRNLYLFLISAFFFVVATEVGVMKAVPPVQVVGEVPSASMDVMSPTPLEPAEARAVSPVSTQTPSKAPTTEAAVEVAKEVEAATAESATYLRPTSPTPTEDLSRVRGSEVAVEPAGAVPVEKGPRQDETSGLAMGLWQTPVFESPTKTLDLSFGDDGCFISPCPHTPAQTVVLGESCFFCFDICICVHVVH